MTGDEGIVLYFGLRLIGAFYAVASVIAIRTAAMTSFLDRALGAIGRVDPRETSAERNRTILLVANSVLFGIGGTLLAAKLDIAALVFSLSAALYALYLFVICPRYLDPWDPPEEPGRSQTRNAFWVYLVATAIVLGAWWNGNLRPYAEEPIGLLAVVALLILGLFGYALHQFRPWQKMEPFDRSAMQDESEDDGPPRSVVLTPSWYGSGMVDAAAGEPVYWLPESDCPADDQERINEWLDLFKQIADPDDPLKTNFKAPDGLQRMEAAGRPIYERLLSRMGADRVRFEPAPRPAELIEVAAVKLLAERDGDPLRRIDADGDRFISPQMMPISWALSEALHEWTYRYYLALDPEDFAAAPKWSADEAGEHRRQGRNLAKRLVAELAATGRSHVEVWYQPHGEKLERIAT